MFELYLDTAQLADIERLSMTLPLAGVTTNPSLLASGNIGLNQWLPTLIEHLGVSCRVHIQIISRNVKGIVAEAQALHDLPYDIVVKIPAHAEGLAAIKELKRHDIPILATAIYNTQQGMLAALHGADYLAPYLNRIENQGGDGIGVIAELQNVIERYRLPSKLLVASFKNVQQVMQVMKLGVGAVTLPVEIADHMLTTPATDAAVEVFQEDWQRVFGERLVCES